MKISKYFSLEEFTRSATADKYGLDNKPVTVEVLNLQMLAENTLDPIRELAGRPVIVTSGYRSRQLNKLVHGVSNSQHTTGQAADLRVVGVDLEELVGKIVNSDIPYDQLILEPGWIHVSYVHNKNRRQALRAIKTSTGGMRYEPF